MVKSKRWGSPFKDKREWKVYHKELIIRGEFFFDFDFLERWDEEVKEMNTSKRGHPFEYPDSLIHWLSPMYSILDSRKLEGALRRLSKYIPRLKACDHSTIIARLNALEQLLVLDKNRSYRTAIDVTGCKLGNRGEYIRHKWAVKRGWIKVSIIIDRFTKELLDVEVALEEVSDYKQYRHSFGGYKSKVNNTLRVNDNVKILIVETEPQDKSVTRLLIAVTLWQIAWRF